jgi:hypothetical protein
VAFSFASFLFVSLQKNGEIDFEQGTSVSEIESTVIRKWRKIIEKLRQFFLVCSL